MTLAANDLTQKNITGLAFDTVYDVRVVAVNNDDYNGISRSIEALTGSAG